MKLSIHPWQEPLPSEPGIAVVFDVFRCTTTLQALASRTKQIYVRPHLAAFSTDGLVFSELPETPSCQERFDNSPSLALTHTLKPECPYYVATTTGTPAMFAARQHSVLLGSLTNFSALVAFLSEQSQPIYLLPAAPQAWQHVEDEITAMAVATALEGYFSLPEFVSACAKQAKERILQSGRVEYLSQKLPTGQEDTAIALSIDRFPSLLRCAFESDTKARVELVS